MAEDIVTQIEDSLHSIIGEGTRLCGDFEVKGLLRIDGDFCGTIRTNGKVLVSKNGRADCTIDANIVVIGGVVKGTIVARRSVEILSSGVVIGTIIAPRLIAHENVILHGVCRVTRDTGRLDSAIRLLEEQVTARRGRPEALPPAMEADTAGERIAR